MKWFSAPGTETSTILLKNPERVKGGEEAGGVEKCPGARDGDKGAEEGDIEWGIGSLVMGMRR